MHGYTGTSRCRTTRLTRPDCVVAVTERQNNSGISKWQDNTLQIYLPREIVNSTTKFYCIVACDYASPLRSFYDHLSDAPILRQFGLSTRFKKCSELSLQDAPFATTRLGA